MQLSLRIYAAHDGGEPQVVSVPPEGASSTNVMPMQGPAAEEGEGLLHARLQRKKHMVVGRTI